MELTSQGLRLKILLKQKNILIKDAAPLLGYGARESLSRMFRQDVLPSDLVQKAAKLLKVPQSDITGIDVELRYIDEVNEETPAYVTTYTSDEVKRLTKELEEAKRETLELKARVYDLLREKGKL